MVFSAYVISQSDYKSIIRNTRVPFGGLSNIKANFKGNLSDNECFFIDGNTDPRYCQKLQGKTADIRSGSQVCRYEISGVSLHKYIGIFDLYQMPTFVVNDTAFSGFLAKADKEDIVGVTGLIFNKFNGWDKTNDALDKVAPVHRKALNMMGMANFSVINISRSIYSMYGAYVFIGMFLGILFLLASGSIMYYKQIIEAQEEVERYEILKKTGMSRKEAKQSIVRQLGIIFGIPLTVGLLHTFFAVLTYNRTMDLSGKEMPLVANAFLIVAVYIVIYCFYYGLSVKSYMKIAWREKTA
jgi:putative ABC transport system permease protein